MARKTGQSCGDERYATRTRFAVFSTSSCRTRSISSSTRAALCRRSSKTRLSWPKRKSDVPIIITTLQKFPFVTDKVVDLPNSLGQIYHENTI